MSKRGSLKAIRIGGKSFGFPKINGRSRHKKRKTFAAKSPASKSYWKKLVNSKKKQDGKKTTAKKIIRKSKSISGLHLDNVEEVKKRQQTREQKRTKVLSEITFIQSDEIANYKNNSQSF